MHVFDKAEYHEDSCVQDGVARRQARVHTGLFLAWAHRRGLVRDDAGPRWVGALMRWRVVPPSTLYFFSDGTLTDRALTDEGARFAHAYFDFERGQYLADLDRVLVRGADSVFRVADARRNLDLLAPTLDARLAAFRGEPLALPPLPTGAPIHV